MAGTEVKMGLMTIDEFLRFYELRPKGEKWELVEGVPVMSPSATNWHQVIAGNICIALGNAKLTSSANWVPALGMSTRVPASPDSLPEPDVMVFEHPLGKRLPITEDAFVLFEVLSDSNSRKDQAWRRKVYASVPNCRHYVTIDSRSVAAVRYDRDLSWAQAAEHDALADQLELPALGCIIPLQHIYRWTPLCV